MNCDQILAERKAFLYDCEIVSAIQNKGEQRDPSLYYCKGWDDFADMGISVTTAYDFTEKAYRIFFQDNLDELRQLISIRDIVIGWNNHRFDDNLLAANKIPVPKEKSYDLWEQVVVTQPDGQRAGFSLANMLAANKLPAKSGLGAHAPKLAQTGQWGRLVNYCLDDTRLSVMLLRLACNDAMVNPKNGGQMIIKKPWDVIAPDPYSVIPF